MHIINLKIQDKQVIGDGTKIVCMNGDYAIRLEYEDCKTFEDSAVKKLVIKHGTDYREVDIEQVNNDGDVFEGAILPPIKYTDYVDLGVCGKESENADPKFTSLSARFECIKSILSGAIVLQKDPTLTTLDVTENGKYLAVDKDADGFYEVDVNIASAVTEERTVALAMSSGDQIVEPIYAEHSMSKVVVTKPRTLIPDNIKKGVDVGGVIGTYDKVLVETEVFKDGTYIPPAGADGFSKVIVNVDSVTIPKILRIGDTFTYDYDTSVQVTIDTPGIIKYEDSGDLIIVTAISVGNCGVLLRDFDENGNVIKTIHYAILVEMTGEQLLPREAPNVVEMMGYLTTGIVGGIVKYTGNNSPADGLVQNGIYIIQEETDGT